MKSTTVWTVSRAENPKEYAKAIHQMLKDQGITREHFEYAWSKLLGDGQSFGFFWHLQAHLDIVIDQATGTTKELVIMRDNVENIVQQIRGWKSDGSDDRG